jgi:hypothetical protein
MAMTLEDPKLTTSSAREPSVTRGFALPRFWPVIVSWVGLADESVMTARIRGSSSSSSSSSAQEARGTVSVRARIDNMQVNAVNGLAARFDIASPRQSVAAALKYARTSDAGS